MDFCFFHKAQYLYHPKTGHISPKVLLGWIFRFPFMHKRKKIKWVLNVLREGYKIPCWRDLEWWLEPQNLEHGHPLQLAIPDHLLYTDAANDRWGMPILQDLVSGLWDSQERLLHISVLELRGLLHLG
ncbi:hypothetical protein E2C01_035996 [Portunus trituberculatus]|uniref:Uncharacterized protein n=1 Tax=Portunus trituberculatus TaxID=210409 RepID=A0A5B7FAN0_PORTR|nr:hypothetical protein [Portunus trituberculatus]